MAHAPSQRVKSLPSTGGAVVPPQAGLVRLL